MNVLTVELANFLELKTTNFAHLFTQLKLRLLIDIVQKDILPNTELYELFDKIPTNEVYKLLMLPKFWKVVVSCRNCNNYFQDVRQLLANEVYFLSFKPYEYQLNKSDLINEKKLTWNLRGDLAYKYKLGYIYKNNITHTDSDILLDFYSDLVRGKQKDIPWNDTGLKSHYITSSSSKIIGALDYIKAISESCYTTLKDSIFTIAIRFDNTKDKFNCASTNICNGLIILINPHLDNVSIETVADAIVHEMIHNLFDVAELYEPCLPTKFHPRIIESPWTKRMLDPNTYIQACYTWYGLKCFWQKAHECEKSQNAYYYLQQSSKGFASSEFIDVAKNSEFEFDQKIISTLERFKISGC